MGNMTVRIRRLIWDAWNRNHLAKHDVVVEEVTQVARTHRLVLTGDEQKRLIVVGATDEGRVLEVVLHPLGSGDYYPLTAYDASFDMQVVYKRRVKGGEGK